MNIDLFLLTYSGKNHIDKKIKLEKYLINEIGPELFEDTHIDLRKLKKRIPLCYDIKSALEENGYDSFKFIKENSSYSVSFTYNNENYEIRNFKLKEPSIINMFIDLVANLFSHF